MVTPHLIAMSGDLDASFLLCIILLSLIGHSIWSVPTSQAVWVAAAELWAMQREGDASCRLSKAPSAAPYAHALAPLVRRLHDVVLAVMSLQPCKCAVQHTCHSSGSHLTGPLFHPHHLMLATLFCNQAKCTLVHRWWR